MMGGLTEEASREYHDPNTPRHVLENLEHNARRGVPLAQDMIADIPQRTVINPGLVVEPKTGTKALGMSGVLILGGVLDGGFQLGADLFGQRCLSPRQIALRALIAGGMAIGIGGIGASIGASLLARGPILAGLSSLGSTTLLGLFNDAIVKPRVYKALGLN